MFHPAFKNRENSFSCHDVTCDRLPALSFHNFLCSCRKFIFLPFHRALCCCLCSNCGYCCYDEKRMAEKERKMKKKRQQMEMRVQQLALQEPYYVRSGTLTNNNSKNIHSPEKHPPTILMPPEIDSLSTSESHASSMHGLSILAPICLCLCMMIVYIVIGALVLYRLEEWPMLDGIYFCFMALSTIGFGDLMPGLRKDSTATLWFCSIYIMSGMALTAMCFNVLHDEIMHRIKHVVDIKSRNSLTLNHHSHPHQQQFNLNSTKAKLINEATSASAANDDYLNSWRYEKNTNLYQRNPTEETLITGKAERYHAADGSCDSRALSFCNVKSL